MTVENYDTVWHEIKDFGIPGARVRLEAGATYVVSRDVWYRQRRRCAAWLRVVEAGRVRPLALAKQKPSVPEAVPEQPQETPHGKPLEEAPYGRLQEIAKSLGLKYNGVKKADLIAAIREARDTEGQSETDSEVPEVKELPSELGADEATAGEELNPAEAPVETD